MNDEDEGNNNNNHDVGLGHGARIVQEILDLGKFLRKPHFRQARSIISRVCCLFIVYTPRYREIQLDVSFDWKGRITDQVTVTPYLSCGVWKYRSLHQEILDSHDHYQPPISRCRFTYYHPRTSSSSMSALSNVQLTLISSNCLQKPTSCTINQPPLIDGAVYLDSSWLVPIVRDEADIIPQNSYPSRQTEVGSDCRVWWFNINSMYRPWRFPELCVCSSWGGSVTQACQGALFWSYDQFPPVACILANPRFYFDVAKTTTCTTTILSKS